MRRLVLGALVASTAGCDLVWRIDAFSDAAPAPSEGGLDAPACSPIGHDEDQDGVDDACDNCPTVRNAAQANTMEPSGAADAVGDLCDPNPTMPGDRIAFFVAFVPTDLAMFTKTGAVTQNADTITFGGNATIATVDTIANPTTIVVKFHYTGTANALNSFAVTADVFRVGLALKACGTGLGLNCITSTNGTDIFEQDTVLVAMNLDSIAADLPQQRVTLTGGATQVAPTVKFNGTSAHVGFVTNGVMAAAELDSLVVYAR